MNDKILNNSQNLMDKINPVEIDNSSQKKTATDSIESFMQSENVSLICYIDDRADIDSSKPNFTGSISSIYDEEDKPQELNFIDWTIKPKQRFEQYVSDLWDKSSEPEKKDYFHRLSIYNDDSNTIPALEIEELLKDKIRLFSPKEWVADDYKIFKELEEGNKLLCLFDIEFTNGAKLEDGRDGLDLAKHLLDSEHNSKCICGVFSHLFSIEEEDEKRQEYIATKGLPEKQFYTISKNRFAFDPKISAFAEGIKNLILLPYIEDLKEKSIESFKASLTQAIDKISKVSPKTFNQIVQKSSLKEGIWEVNTLFRLFNIISKEENLNNISIEANRASFSDGIKKIRSVDAIQTGYNNLEINQQLFDLRKSEIYLNGSIINPLHFPVSNGDIFSINNKEYILLVQPCNLAIRAKYPLEGKRAYDYKNAILVPIREGDISKLSSVTNVKIESPGLTGKIKYADFSNFKIASLDLIDLVVFNETGEAVIDMKIENYKNELIHFPWLKRYTYIHKEFQKFEKGLINFNNLKATHTIPNNSNDYNSLKTFIYAPECLKDLKINGPDIYDFGTKIFKFKLKRVSHYKSPYSDDLLQQFMQYLSRNAFDHDFTNN